MSRNYPHPRVNKKGRQEKYVLPPSCFKGLVNKKLIRPLSQRLIRLIVLLMKMEISNTMDMNSCCSIFGSGISNSNIPNSIFNSINLPGTLSNISISTSIPLGSSGFSSSLSSTLTFPRQYSTVL